MLTIHNFLEMSDTVSTKDKWLAKKEQILLLRTRLKRVVDEWTVVGLQEEANQLEMDSSSLSWFIKHEAVPKKLP